MVSRIHMSFSVKLAAAAVLGLAAVTPGLAQEISLSGDVVSVRVPAADLDLSREGDARVLIERVRRAAKIACGSGQISMHRRADCADASAGTAIRSLDLPTLTALYDRTGLGQADAVPLAQAGRRPAGS